MKKKYLRNGAVLFLCVIALSIGLAIANLWGALYHLPYL